MRGDSSPSRERRGAGTKRRGGLQPALDGLDATSHMIAVHEPARTAAGPFWSVSSSVRAAAGRSREGCVLRRSLGPAASQLFRRPRSGGKGVGRTLARWSHRRGVLHRRGTGPLVGAGLARVDGRSSWCDRPRDRRVGRDSGCCYHDAKGLVTRMRVAKPNELKTNRAPGTRGFCFLRGERES